MFFFFSLIVFPRKAPRVVSKCHRFKHRLWDEKEVLFAPLSIVVCLLLKGLWVQYLANNDLWVY